MKKYSVDVRVCYKGDDSVAFNIVSINVLAQNELSAEEEAKKIVKEFMLDIYVTDIEEI